PAGTLPAELSVSGAGPPLGANESAALESYVPGEIRVRSRSTTERFLVVSESWSPGWRATVDGLPAPIYRTNYVIQGLAVPPGDHEVRLVYDPPAFRWGVAISLAAMVCWLALFAWSLVMRRSVIAAF